MFHNLLFLMAASISSAASAQAPAAPLSISPCDVGERYQFEKATCSLEFHNSTEKTVRISRIEPRLARDAIEPKFAVVPPKSVAYFQATVDFGNKAGLAYHSFQFTMEGTEPKQRSSGVSAYVQSVLDQPRPKLDFGVVRHADTKWPIVKSIALSSREVRDLRVTRVEEAPSWLDVKVDEDGRTLLVSMKKDVPWGLLHEESTYVKVGLNTPQQPHAWIEIQANVLGAVVPDANPFQLGMMRTIGTHEYLVRLSSPAGEDFKLGKLSMKGIKGKVDTKPCAPAAVGCRLLRVSVDNDQPIGKLVGSIEVDLPQFGRKLPVELFGVLIPPETKIHDFDELPVASGAQSNTASSGIDLRNEIQGAIKHEDAPPPGNGPLLRWSATHQLRIYGYVIYRADSEDGPLTRVSKDVIQIVADNNDASGSYQWRDNNAEAGKTYWYLIGILNRDGSKEDLTGRQKVVAK
jgi:hypothetical protein